MIRKYTHGRFTLVLDSAEIIPDNPGEGTPELLIYTAPNGRVGNKTYFCALDTGTYTDEKGRDIELTDNDYLWLELMLDKVNAFWEAYENGK